MFPQHQPMVYGGFRIIQNPNMTTYGDPYKQRRTWRERLLSVPWRPWQKFKTITPVVPSNDIYQLEDCIICHPETAKKIQAAIKPQEQTP